MIQVPLDQLLDLRAAHLSDQDISDFHTAVQNQYNLPVAETNTLVFHFLFVVVRLAQEGAAVSQQDGQTVIFGVPLVSLLPPQGHITSYHQIKKESPGLAYLYMQESFYKNMKPHAQRTYVTRESS